MVALAAVAIATLCVPVSAMSARLVWNLTPSAPPGIYSIDHAVWRVGDRVAIRPSAVLARDLENRGVLPRGKLLIKRVAAGKGDTVCRYGAEVTVNGAWAATARTELNSGKLLPTWRGCRTLGHADVFLLGDTNDSYDGRYFGLTSAHEIIGRVVLLIAL